MESQKKTVVITGASSGIGRACAVELDEQGYQVFAGVRREADGQRLVEQSSPKLTPLMLDVTDPAAITAAVETVQRQLEGRGLTGLINNAGVAVAGPLEFLPLAELERQFTINVFGQIAVTQAFMPLLRQGHGRIINIGSISGRIAMPFMGPYSASKFALRALTDSLRQELHPWGLHVALIEPGAIDTPIWEKSIRYNLNLASNLPPEATQLYQAALDALPQATRQAASTATSVDKVTAAVMHALTAARPRNQYLVGRDARLAAWMIKLLPAGWRDWLILRLWRG